MKNRKGFTLIEMLAVVTIIGLLAGLIINRINRSIADSRKTTSLANANLLVGAFEDYYMQAKARGAFNGCSYNFGEDSNTCTGFSFTGAQPDEGIIALGADGKVNGDLVFGDYSYVVDDSIVTTYVELDDPVFDFDYVSVGNNKEKYFIAPATGYYKLEVWGAQGASVSSYRGGYGGYSSGIIHLNINNVLYINIGGTGVSQSSTVSTGTSYAGGYNGGGHGYNKGTTSSLRTGGGGGASHIATVSGTLSSLSSYRNTGGENISNEILIVASGGASAYGYGDKWWNGNSGGGMTGDYSFDQSYAATQTTGYQFGQAGSSFGTDANYAGAGGGWYGGISAWGEVGAGGGSGYIGSSRLSNGVMYCYGCAENSTAGTRTVDSNGSNKDSNCPNGYSTNAVSNCAKSGDGHARVTYIGRTLD
jgi:prepilin-type N-terminal cleavage/methylation domain-containing protein